MKAIITADLHIRADKPRCRLDNDWMKAQRDALSFIGATADNKKAPLIVIGDIFNTPNVPSAVLNMVIGFLLSIDEGSHILAGNHGLPYHSWDNVDNSAFGILNLLMEHGSNIHTLGQFGQWAHFGQPFTGNDTGIMFIHELTFPDVKSIPPNTQAKTAPELLFENPEAQWIFTGDYHHSFHYEKKGRHVINPGCIIRQAADMIDYQPKVCYVDTDKDIVEWIDIPDTAEMVTDEYLRAEEAREDRISAFVEGVKESGHVSLSFIDNLEAEVAENKLEPLVESTIRELIEIGEEK